MTTNTAMEVTVIVPSELGGVVVISISELLDRMDNDSATFEQALTDGGFDSTNSDRPEELLQVVTAVRALNQSGDATDYWAIR